ncbi:MAG: L-glutamate gamma-semialdehyde dehydrogenase [Actinomycetia bacterium]|nr:L-glutamate gamma-semialdehyde dehydrogenase [Actinomycetes bacterium]
MDAVANTPVPYNEPVRSYAPGTAERAALAAKLDELAGTRQQITCTIGGAQRLGAGPAGTVVEPHNHAHVLGDFGHVTDADVTDAIEAALAAAPAWRDMPFEERAAVFLRAADLLAGPWRDVANAATMLGQSKTPVQAEIDSACELIDFWRYNVAFARQLLAEQPLSSPGTWNRVDHRPLEGFVYAITPFNFSSIAGNLPTAPAIMGNVVLWKPAGTQLLGAYYIMRVLEAAGLPPGVINMVTGNSRGVSAVALAHPALAGIHFTGSTEVFQQLWQTVGSNLPNYHTYPRLVGETGGKDFVLAHPSADVDVLRTALVRGAFEYQGQKCSAASRAYIPQSVWAKLEASLVAETEGLAMGDIADFSNFMGAVIDRASFDNLAGVIERAKADPSIKIIAGGTADASVGYFVRPTILLGSDPKNAIFRDEYFGPILSIHVYPDAEFDAILDVVDTASSYGLTGAIIANDRAAINQAAHHLRFAAGNFYVNDKPTGAVVGQQPFGGARASGTNDKAGSILNLQRWVSPRAIKETFVPPTAVGYPHMERDAD